MMVVVGWKSSTGENDDEVGLPSLLCTPPTPIVLLCIPSSQLDSLDSSFLHGSYKNVVYEKTE